MNTTDSKTNPMFPSDVGVEGQASVEEMAMMERALAATSEGITITDARLPDNPIIYANPGFERLTGYAVRDILGRNCRFLQGPDPDQATVEEIRRAVSEARACTVEILNYRKDGAPFWNRLSITPVQDASGVVTHFVGVQSDITARKQAEASLRRTRADLEAVNRRMKADLDAAAKIQRTHLPNALPEIAGVNLAWVLQPCDELAGDTLNVVPLDETHVGLYMLDVSGHGVPAALLSVTLSHWLSPNHLLARCFEGGSTGPFIAPAEVAEALNRQFPMDLDTAQYFTLLYGVLDTETLTFRYVTAGHPAPIHMRHDAAPVHLETTGFPVGLVLTPQYEEHVIRLAPGDRLYLYSDGVEEAHNREGEEFGTERFASALDQSREMSLEEGLSQAMAAVREWRQAAGLEDDASILAVEIERKGDV